VHPHMLRHACGFALANKGHDTRGLQAYLGHRYIQHTVRYTELAADRFTIASGGIVSLPVRCTLDRCPLVLSRLLLPECRGHHHRRGSAHRM
jgi:hypothetical protein